MLILSPLLTARRAASSCPLLLVVALRLRHDGVPRQLGRAAARRRGRGRRRRGRHRRAGGQGLRPGAAELATSTDAAERPLPLAGARWCSIQARLHADAAGDPGARPGRGARPRRLAGHRTATSRSARSSPSPVLPVQLVAPVRMFAGARRRRPAGAGRRRAHPRPARLQPARRPSSPTRRAARRLPRRGRVRRRHASATCGPSRCSTASTCTSRPARRSRSSARRARASRRSRCSCPASTTCRPGAVTHRRRRRARRHARLAAPPGRRGVRGELPVLRLGARQHRLRPARRHRRRGRGRGPRGRGRTSSSSRCPTATTRSSASGASRCRAASASASRSPARCSPTRGSSILDDATSSVDAATEEEIHATLRRDHGGPHDVLVAHRRSTLRLADRIVVVDDGRVVDDGHPRGAARPLRRCYRDAARRARATTARATTSTADERRSTAIAAAASTRRATASTPSARWPTRPRDGEPGRDGRRAPGAGAHRAAGGGGGGGGGWRHGAGRHARAARRSSTQLPPADDEPDVDVDGRGDGATPAFQPRAASSGRYRRPLGVGLGARRRSTRCSRCSARCSSGAASTTASTARSTTRAVGRRRSCSSCVGARRLGRHVGATRAYTGRTAERLLLRAADPHLRPPPAAVARLLRPRAGGPDHDPHDHRRRGALAAAPDRPDQRVVSMLHASSACFVLLVINWRSPLAADRVVILPPLSSPRGGSAGASTAAYDRARDAHRRRQRQPPGEPVGRARRAGLRPRGPQHRRRSAAVDGEYLDARLGRAAARRPLLPVRPVARRTSADAVVLGVGAALVADGTLTAGVVIAFLLYLDQFFSPIQQLSQVFDTWQQARRVDRDDRRADGHADGHAGSRRTRSSPAGCAGAVRFEDVHFALPDARVGEALARRRPRRSRRARRVALVGETGAGKSTIVKLVARFYDPTAGACSSTASTVRDARPRRVPPPARRRARRRRSCSPARSATTSPTAGPTPPTPRSRRRPGPSAPTTSSPRCPAATCTPVSERGRSLSSGQRQLIAPGPGPPRRPGDPAARRGDLEPRPRPPRPGCSGPWASSPRAARRSLIAHRLPDRPHRRPHRRVDDGRDRRGGHPRRAARPRRRATPRCGRSSPHSN